MTHVEFDIFSKAQQRPAIDHKQSTKALWTNPHIAKQMLEAHLDPTHDAASYRRELIDRSVGWMYTHFGLTPEHCYLDLGCGPGLYTQRMAEKGVHVTGVDFSENSIRYARAQLKKRGLRGDYRCQNYLEVDFANRFDLVTLISCDFTALLPSDRSVFLENVRRALKDAGVFLFDFHSLTRFRQLSEYSSWRYYDTSDFHSEGPHLLLTNQFLFEGERICCTKYTVLQADGKVHELYLWHRYYSLNDVIRILADAGLQIIEAYGSIDGKPFTGEELDITVVAQKTG